MRFSTGQKDMKVTWYWYLISLWTILSTAESPQIPEISPELGNLVNRRTYYLTRVYAKESFLDQTQPTLVVLGNKASVPVVGATSPLCNSSAVFCNLSLSVSACTCTDQDAARVDESTQLLNCAKCYVNNCSRRREGFVDRLLANPVRLSAHCQPRVLVQLEVRRRRKVHQKHLERLANHSRISLSYYCFSAFYFAAFSVRSHILQTYFPWTKPEDIVTSALLFLQFRRGFFHPSLIPVCWKLKQTIPPITYEKYFLQEVKRNDTKFTENDALCYEWIRLKTFANWPSWAQGFPSEYARAGFSYTSTNDEVVCFSCHLTIGNWKKGMNPLEEHKARGRQCEFISGVNPGDIPIHGESVPDSVWTPPGVNIANQAGIQGRQSTDSSQESLADQVSLFAVKMKEEKHRLETYRSWSKLEIVDPASLAQSGLYFTGEDDIVKCAFCNGVLSGFQRGDVPNDLHVIRYPSCQFARERLRSHDLDRAIERLSRTGSIEMNPAFPNFSTLESRLASFEGWPKSQTHPPADMASAGFFYAGLSDCVKCHHCEIGLRNWLPDDDPWCEHARWFPSCPFLKRQQSYALTAASSRSDLLEQKPSHVFQATLTNELPRDTSDRSHSDTAVRGPSADCLTVVPHNNVREGFGDKGIPRQHQTDGTDTERQELLSLVEENRELHEKTMCKICLTEQCQLTFLPCGHLVTCLTCGPKLRKCPICRATIKGRVRIYMA